jgi:hypothetical protein
MWIRRMVRRTGWGRNPLRRTSDRVEAWLTLVLVAAMAALGPWAASRAAHRVYRDDVRSTAWEMQHHAQVDAVLLQDARQDPGYDGSPPPQSVPTMAQWSGQDATISTGTIYADEGSRAGSTVRIWIDDQGLVTGPPGRRNPSSDAATAAVLTVVGVAAGIAGIRRIIRWQLNRHRMRAWQLEWMSVGPAWSRRR